MDDLTIMLGDVLSQSHITKKKEKKNKLKTKKAKEKGPEILDKIMTTPIEKKNQSAIRKKCQLKVLHTISSDEDSNNHDDLTDERNQKKILLVTDSQKSDLSFDKLYNSKKNKMDKVSNIDVTLFTSISSDDDFPQERNYNKKNSTIFGSADSSKQDNDLQDLSSLLESVLSCKEKKERSETNKILQNDDDIKTCIPDSQENENSNSNISISSSSSVVSSLSSTSMGSSSKSVLSNDVSIQECTSLLEGILCDPRKKKMSKQKKVAQLSKAYSKSILLETVISDEDNFDFTPMKRSVKSCKASSKKSTCLLEIVLSDSENDEKNPKETVKNKEEKLDVSTSSSKSALLENNIENEACFDNHLRDYNLKSESEMTFSTFIMDSASDEECENVKTEKDDLEHESPYFFMSDKTSDTSVQDSIKKKKVPTATLR